MDQHSEQPTGPAAGLAAGWPAARKMAAGSELAVLLATRPLRSLSDAELIDATAASHRLAGHFEAHTLAAMEELHTRREAEPRRPYDIDATQQSTAELRPVLAASAIRVQGQLRTVRSLTRDVPLLGRLVFAGRLPVWVAGKCVTEMSLLTDKAKVPIVEKRLLARLLDLAPPTKTGDHDDSDPLSEFGRALELALTDVEVVRWTPGQVLTLIRQLVAAAEPEEFDSRFRAAFRDRRTSASTDPQDNPPGMGRLTITHTGHDVETADHRLSLLARQFGADDPRSMDQRKADLAIDLLCGRIEVATSTSALEAGDEPVRIRLRDPRPGRAQVNVSVPIQTLLGVSDDPGQTLSGLPIPASLARRIAVDPDSTWYRLLTDQAGNMVELSTRAYAASDPLWRAICTRDRTCPFPCCNGSALAGDTDHTHTAAAGGPTSYPNSGRPCRAHHHVRHSRGFGLSQPAPGVFTWTFPTGHSYTTRPQPHPVGHWPRHWSEPGSAAELSRALALLARDQAAQTDRGIHAMRRAYHQARLQVWRHDNPDPDPPPEDVAGDDMSTADWDHAWPVVQDWLELTAA